jgi:hypothetical protein
MNTAINARRNIKNEKSTTQRYLTTLTHTHTHKPATSTNLNQLGATKRRKQLNTDTKHHHGYAQRPVGGHKEGRTRERATKDIKTSGKKRRRTSTHARTITRKKTEEQPQAKEIFSPFHTFHIFLQLLKLLELSNNRNTHTLGNPFSTDECNIWRKKQYRKENTKNP